MAAGPDSLLNELPDVDNELVPLPHLVERVTAQAYNDLAGLAETYVATNEGGRRGRWAGMTG
jgi:hypothetical protein